MTIYVDGVAATPSQKTLLRESLNLLGLSATELIGPALELVNSIAVTAQSGIMVVATTAERDLFFASPANQLKLVYVNNNNDSSADPENGVYEWVDGSARLAEAFYTGVSYVVMPLVSRAEAAAIQTEEAMAEVFESGDYGDLLWGVFTRAGRKALWLQARKSDGGPTDWAMTRLLARMEEQLGLQTKMASYQVESIPGILFSVVDSKRRMTDLTVRSEDGKVPDHVILDWKSRMGLVSVGADLVAPRLDLIVGDGSSTVANMESKLRVMAGGLSAVSGPETPTYVNRARGGERSEHAMARNGSRPALVTIPGGTIPASGSVNVTLSNVPPDMQFLASKGYVGNTLVTLAFVSGSFTLTREIPGDPVPVTPDTPFIPTVGPASRNAVGIYSFGKNDVNSSAEYPTDSAENVINRISEFFQWIEPVNPNFVWLGMFCDTGTLEVQARRDKINAVNAYCKDYLGDRYIDLSGYLTGTQVWADTGISPNSADLSQQALGNLPASLSIDAGHMNSATEQQVIDKLIRPRLVSFGLYS